MKLYKVSSFELFYLCVFWRCVYLFNVTVRLVA